MTSPSTGAGHVNHLLSLHGVDFVTAAYRSLLGREPDPYGMQNYLARLKHDIDKGAILYELAISDEGRARAANVGGLQELVRSRAPSRNWFKRTLNKFRRVELSGARLECMVSAMGHDLDQRLRAMDNRLAEMSHHAAEREARLLATLAQAQAAARAAGPHPAPAHATQPTLSVEQLVSLASSVRARES